MARRDFRSRAESEGPIRGKAKVKRGGMSQSTQKAIDVAVRCVAAVAALAALAFSFKLFADQASATTVDAHSSAAKQSMWMVAGGVVVALLMISICLKGVNFDRLAREVRSHSIGFFIHGGAIVAAGILGGLLAAESAPAVAVGSFFVVTLGVGDILIGVVAYVTGRQVWSNPWE